MAVYVIYEDNNESIDVSECVNGISYATTNSRVYYRIWDYVSECGIRNFKRELINFFHVIIYYSSSHAILSLLAVPITFHSAKQYA